MASGGDIPYASSAKGSLAYWNGKLVEIAGLHSRRTRQVVVRDPDTKITLGHPSINSLAPTYSSGAPTSLVSHCGPQRNLALELTSMQINDKIQEVEDFRKTLKVVLKQVPNWRDELRDCLMEELQTDLMEELEEETKDELREDDDLRDEVKGVGR